MSLEPKYTLPSLPRAGPAVIAPPVRYDHRKRPLLAFTAMMLLLRAPHSATPVVDTTGAEDRLPEPVMVSDQREMTVGPGGPEYDDTPVWWLSRPTCDHTCGAAEAEAVTVAVTVGVTVADDVTVAVPVGEDENDAVRVTLSDDVDVDVVVAVAVALDEPVCVAVADAVDVAVLVADTVAVTDAVGVTEAVTVAVAEAESEWDTVAEKEIVGEGDALKLGVSDLVADSETLIDMDEV